MSDNPEQLDMFGSLLDSLSDIGGSSGAVTVTKEADHGDMVALLRSHANGLLNEPNLSDSQIKLLEVVLSALTARK